MPNAQQLAKIKAGQGFIAALDQSGGSTPKALKLYGIDDTEYSNDDDMFDKIHDMRSRIVNAPAFNGENVIGAILFEMTMDRQINGKPSAATLWEDNGVVPFLKVDKGLEDTHNGVKRMKPIPGLDCLLARATENNIFGTKMRSVIDAANPEGISAIVAQQFDIARQIMAHGLVPILEPEVTISITDKAEAETLLRDEILSALDTLSDDQIVMLKLTLPEIDNQYESLINHPNVASVVALSGGYCRSEANDRLSRQSGMIASFSRALTEGLMATQTDDEFNDVIENTINSIRAASIAG